MSVGPVATSELQLQMSMSFPQAFPRPVIGVPSPRAEKSVWPRARGWGGRELDVINIVASISRPARTPAALWRTGT
eukprot:3988027-Pyramimonas_sp.AAC.1